MKSFIITVDTEGDNLWSKPAEVETKNAECLIPFQLLCEGCGMRPTYLVNYEMACSAVFKSLADDVLKRGTAEIGMHLHAWNTPPLAKLTTNDLFYQPYLIEYPDKIMKQKIQYMTKLLEDSFQVKPVSHRAGRWAIDARYVQMLFEEGYKVDCSVTPFVSWRKEIGAPNKQGGTDYINFPSSPYFISTPNIREQRHNSGLLEVPMTIQRVFSLKNLLRILANKFQIGSRSWHYDVRWLRPNGFNLQEMLNIVSWASRRETAVLVFMIHSSELMLGGSPYFRSPAMIKKLTDDIGVLFREIKNNFECRLLKEMY